MIVYDVYYTTILCNIILLSYIMFKWYINIYDIYIYIIIINIEYITNNIMLL